jgi:hypothetical protein
MSPFGTQSGHGSMSDLSPWTQERFDIKPERLAGDTAYGSGANLNWLVKDKDIAPHIPVIDKSKREDGTFSREDFTFYRPSVASVSGCMARTLC